MLKFKMAERKSERFADRIITYSSIGHLSPTDGRQANIWSVQIRKQNAVPTRVPPKKVQNACDASWAVCLPLFRRSRHGPRPRARRSSIETKLAAHLIVNLSFMKV